MSDKKTDKRIDTIVEDIYGVLEEGLDLSDEETEKIGKKLGEAVRHSLKRQRGGTLRMSSIGQPCNRKIYYAVNTPEDAEPMSGATYMKFLTGHLLEEALLFLAEKAGHTVEGEQDEVEIEGIKGHRDCVIDGVTIDVKSASTYSFKKFEDHGLADNDPFGYIDQIQSYLHCGQVDPIVTDKERCGFLVVDKTLGNICLDIHKKRPFPIEKIYQYKKDMVSRDTPPARGFNPEPEGKSGNMKLPMNCSYCDFKKKCHPDLRTFLYARGPVFLTTVKKEPDVPEMKSRNDRSQT